MKDEGLGGLQGPPDLQAALDGSPDAAEAWRAFSQAHRKEYLDWIEEAKRPETRARRISKAVAMLAEQRA